MQTKLTTLAQLDQLLEGSLIIRFPAHGAPKDVFDELGEKDVYKIIKIDRNDRLVKLVQADEGLEMFTWPQDIERLSIGLSKILSEKTWWIP